MVHIIYRNSPIYIVLPIILVCLFLSSCSTPPRPQPPVLPELTEEEKNITIIQNTKESSFRLRKYCKVAKVLPALRDYDLRKASCLAGGNVVQLLKTGTCTVSSSSNYSHGYYTNTKSCSVVYSCPSDMGW